MLYKGRKIWSGSSSLLCCRYFLLIFLFGCAALQVFFWATEKEEIMLQISRSNERQLILNEDTFGPLKNESVVIVIQVHKRLTNLRHFINSLGQVKDISTALLIFSHDYFDQEINTLVQSVTFCKVMQIFFPYSIQLYPEVFPGNDPNDCGRNLTMEEAKMIRCNNFEWPDLYGHYREAKFTQIKHHWWWKANRIFDELEVTKYYSGPVIFLEEDHYVAEDLLHLLKLMHKRSNDICSTCNILSLGSYLPLDDYSGNSNKVDSSPWISSQHNMGMVFTRELWTEIRNCSTAFCSFDDYNWDWSLQYISEECLQQKLQVISLRAPRVFHIGECGVHHKKQNCDPVEIIAIVEKVLHEASIARKLYPESLQLVKARINNIQIPPRIGNGGWGDKRDQELCVNMSRGIN